MNNTGLTGIFLGLTGKSMIKLGQLSFIITFFLVKKQKTALGIPVRIFPRGRVYL